MPVRRRENKRRLAHGLEQWTFVFSTGHDYFGQLAEVGVETDQYGRPSMTEAEAAWKRFGEAFMELPRHPDLPAPWALETFGTPWVKAKRRR
ncbi:hypothetical protein CN231_10315 [Sinorhizobium meliloti]|nr:hypothetical protein CN231_10315 [Sinorhizobium meliloti]RVP13385.1 hypothetical protein CN085_18490 [Sinorhizobium meliloti]